MKYTEFIYIFELIDFPIILRGSVAFSLLVGENRDVDDIDLIVSNQHDLNKLLSLFKRENIDYLDIEYKCNKRKIPRKRIQLKTSNLNTIILDILIYDGYFQQTKKTISGINNLLIPTKDEIMAEILVSISPTPIGMPFYCTKEKKFDFFKRISHLQSGVNGENVYQSIKRILKIQNKFHETNVQIEEILAGVHRVSKSIINELIHKKLIEIDILPIILNLCRVIKKNHNTSIINFFKSDQDFGCFSNFSNHTVVFNSIEWPTAEHCYQAQKFIDVKMWSLILKQESPKDAANVGRSYPEKLRSDWEFAKCLKMYEIVKAKVIQNPDVYLTLISTEGKRIFETNPNDNYWGIGANKNGKNVLGKIYECIRVDIK